MLYNLYFKRVTPITMKSILPSGPLKTKWIFGRLKMRVTEKLKMAYFRQNVCLIQSFVK